MKKVRDIIEVSLAKGLPESWGFGFKDCRPHVNYDTGEIDGQTVELLINRDDFQGYGDGSAAVNYGETVVLHHIGATERTYAGFEPGSPCEVEVEGVRPRCSTFFDTKFSAMVLAVPVSVWALS